MPERMCIVTREVRDEAELVRFVRRLMVRSCPISSASCRAGAFGCQLTRQCGRGAKRNLFRRGFGEQAKASPDLADLGSSLLRQQAVGDIVAGPQSRAGAGGFHQSGNGAATRPRCGMLLHAPDAVPTDGMAKLDRLAGPETLISVAFTAA